MILTRSYRPSGDGSTPRYARAPMSSPLRPLPDLLHDEPALTQVLGRSSAVLAVPEPARAVVVAAVSRLSSRQPIVVAVPTSGDADRLAADLGAFLGDDEVELFPAWETLPFERVSPGVETMGRRLRVMWHLRQAAASARPRASWSRAPRSSSRPCGPWCSGSARTSRTSSRSSSATATSVDPAELVGRARGRPATGASTRSSTAARSRCAARSSTCSRRPPTCRCASTCGATRSTASPSSRSPTSAPPSTSPRSRSSPAASCCRPTRSASGAERSIGARAVGSRAVGAAGRGLSLRRHGVVAAVARPTASTSCSTCSRRLGPGAAGRAAPHARPGRRHPRRGGRPGRARSAGTWERHRAGDRAFPPLHLPVRPPAGPTDAPVWTITVGPRGARRGHRAGRRAGPRSSATATALVAPAPPTCWRDGYRMVVAADGAGSAARLAALLADELTSRRRQGGDLASPAADRRAAARAGLHPAGA